MTRIFKRFRYCRNLLADYPVLYDLSPYPRIINIKVCFAAIVTSFNLGYFLFPVGIQNSPFILLCFSAKDAVTAISKKIRSTNSRTSYYALIVSISHELPTIHFPQSISNHLFKIGFGIVCQKLWHKNSRRNWYKIVYGTILRHY